MMDGVDGASDNKRERERPLIKLTLSHSSTRVSRVVDTR